MNGSAAPDEHGVKPYTITQLNRKVSALLGRRVPLIWVTGEVSNLKPARTGHLYFNLKDARAEVASVLWRDTRLANGIELRDGMQVVVQGRVTLYEVRGRYQLEILQVELRGLGLLRQRFLTLRAKLQAEGLFDQARKKPLPAHPRRAALITSPFGAAVRDMIKSIHARCSADLLILPVRVQGHGAAAEIAEALRRLNRLRDVDLVLVGRGGGSIEDLWAFNEEVVARAIAASRIPVVSAVGHEVDSTIADLVADRAVATPTAAGQVFPDTAAAARRLRQIERRLVLSMRNRLGRLKERLTRLERRPCLQEPGRGATASRQRLEELAQRLRRASARSLLLRRQRVQTLGQRPALRDRMTPVRRAREHVNQLSRQLARQLQWSIDRAKGRLEASAGKLDALSPLRVLSRGYSLTLKEGKPILDATDLSPGDQIETRLARGEVVAEVLETRPETERE